MTVALYRDEDGRVMLSRTADGRWMCALCFEYCAKGDLNQVAPFLDGSIEDICKQCAELEKGMES